MPFGRLHCKEETENKTDRNGTDPKDLEKLSLTVLFSYSKHLRKEERRIVRRLLGNWEEEGREGIEEERLAGR